MEDWKYGRLEVSANRQPSTVNRQLSTKRKDYFTLSRCFNSRQVVKIIP